MAAKKKALGRGLGALIEDSGSESNAEVKSVDEVNIEYIDVNPFQPRSEFNEEALAELASSIKELGIIQPITVRKIHDTSYQLITGERRLRAAKKAGLETIPAFIRTADDAEMLEMALVENIQREDLNAIEIAISYQRLVEECKLTQENLSERVGKKRATITNYLRLLKLPPEIQLGIRNKDISMGHARALVIVDDPGEQLKIYNKVIKDSLSVRKTEELVRNWTENKDKKPEDKKAGQSVPEEYNNLKDHLSNFFQSKVELKRNPKGIGKIVIPFHSDEELERIMGVFDKLNQ